MTSIAQDQLTRQQAHDAARDALVALSARLVEVMHLDESDSRRVEVMAEKRRVLALIEASKRPADESTALPPLGTPQRALVRAILAALATASAEAERAEGAHLDAGECAERLVEVDRLLAQLRPHVPALAAEPSRTLATTE